MGEQVVVAVVGLLGLVAGAVGQYLVARRKAASDDLGKFVEYLKQDSQRDNFTIESAKAILQWYKDDYMRLRERIKELEETLEEERKARAVSEAENRTLRENQQRLELELCTLREEVRQLKKQEGAA